MAERAAFSHQSMQVLQSDKEQNVRAIITGDESWFFVETSVASGWFDFTTQIRYSDGKVSRFNHLAFL
jgi:hypothetical protein